MLCMMEAGTFRTIHMMNHGMTILGTTVGTGIVFISGTTLELSGTACRIWH